MAELLSPLLSRSPEEPAVVDDVTELTWTELDHRVNRWIGLLRTSGLDTGDRVALVTGNRCATFEAVLACLHSGLTVVPVNWHFTAAEIGHLLADSGARALVADPEHAATAAEAAGSRPEPLLLAAVTGADEVAGLAPLEPRLADADAAEPLDQRCGHVLFYTSGTTGRPKGVVNDLFVTGAPMARLARTVEMLGAAFGIPAAGRDLLVGPWYHSGQLFFSAFPLLRGCTLVLRQRFDPASTLRDIDSLGIALTHLVPTQFVRLLRLDAATREAFDGGSLRRVWHGGGACPPDVKRAVIEWWGPVFVEYYAATEIGIATTIDSAEWLARPGSVGRAGPGTELLVVDDAGRSQPVGTEGRVFLRRQGRDFHYHNAPDKTADAHLEPGVYTVGDVGRLDEDGYLYLTGRSAELVVSGGVNVYPAEVEAVLLTHPAVRDAVVIGVPDDEFGERVAALVAAEDGAVGGEELTGVLDRHCRERLAGFKVPRRWHLVPDLPRDPSGKLRRAELREQYAGA